MLICLAAALTSTRQIDPSALSLISKAESRLRRVDTLAGDCIFTKTYTKSGNAQATVIKQVMHVKLSRPNGARVDTELVYLQPPKTQWVRIPDFRVQVADGRMEWSCHPSQHEYSSYKAKTSDFNLSDPMPLVSFFRSNNAIYDRIKIFEDEGLVHSLKLAGKEEWEGAKYQVVQLEYQEIRSTSVVRERYFFGSDHLIRRMQIEKVGEANKSDFALTNLKFNAPIAQAMFSYRPRTDPVKPVEYSDGAAPVLPNGTVAPDFTLKSPSGTPVRLSDFRGKVVILAFWATWCENCMDEFPHLRAIAKARRGDVVVLAADIGDSEGTFRKWVAKNQSYNSFVFGVDPNGVMGKGVDMRLYRVGGIPATYVIGRDGKVMASYMGYSAAFAKELATVLDYAFSHR
jgi:peroxiredoxin/outer membrane lipoprotein-sorting protein